MRDALRVTVSTFGAFAALAGLEHGIGEVAQGNIAPSGIVIESWPESAFFRIVPNLLMTGILTVVVSLFFLMWAILFVQRNKGGLVMILLSLVMLLVGGGFGPPLLGII